MSSFDEFVRNVYTFSELFTRFSHTHSGKKPCIGPFDVHFSAPNHRKEARKWYFRRKIKKNYQPHINEQRNAHTCTPKIEPAHTHTHTEIFHLWSNYNRNITLFTVVYSIFLCSIIIHCPQRHKHTSIEIYIYMKVSSSSSSSSSSNNNNNNTVDMREGKEKKLSENVIPYKCCSFRYFIIWLDIPVAPFSTFIMTHKFSFFFCRPKLY